MGETPAVTVIVPVRNGADTIAAQLQALARQTFAGRWEVVVVDNGSSDSSARIALEWADRLPGLRVVLCPDGPSVSHARNAGARAARAPLLAYCDADDVASAAWLDGIVLGLRTAGMASGPLDFARLNPRFRYAWRGTTCWDHFPDWHRFLPVAGGGNLGVRRSIVESLGGFDETMRTCEDLDFVWRAGLAGHALVFAPAAIMHVRARPGLRSCFVQAYRYAEVEPLLFRRFRGSGMPRLWRRGLARTALLVPSVPMLLLRARRYQWMTLAGCSVGRAVGSVRQRVLYL